MTPAHFRRRVLTLSVLSLFALGATHANADEKKDPPATQQMPPPPTVGVIQAQPQSVTLYETLTGRLSASREAVVRARVDGIVEQRLFKEGSKVRQGDVLYRIDDALYRAALSSAEAQKAQAIAARDLARSTVRRYAPLVKAKAISRQQYDQARAEEQVAQANINAAQAAINQAKIRLDYAKVTAPISGHIGEALVSEGALVSAAQSTELARIQQTDPLKIRIPQSASKILALKKAVASGQSLAQSREHYAVDVMLEDGTPYPHQGRLTFAEQTVDPATGDVVLQAELPNPDDLLLPGLFVRVKVPTLRLDNAYLIPQQAVQRGSQGDIVLVVNKDGSFAPRPVSIKQASGNDWIVDGGLQAGDTVIVDGQMGLRGAKTVNPTPWQAKSASQPAH